MTNEENSINPVESGDKTNLIMDLTFQFALHIIQYTEQFEQEKKYILANQLTRSGTSIGSNVREAQFAESKADFVHKLKIAEKEAIETDYWLLLCKHSKKYPFEESLEQELASIKKLLSKIITTSKKSLLH